MTLSNITMVVIFSYGLVFVNFAASALLLRKKRLVHYLSAALLGDFGVMCIAGGICVYHSLSGLIFNLWVSIPMLLLAPIGSAVALVCLGAWKASRKLFGAILLGTGLVFLVDSGLLLAGHPWREIFTTIYGWLFLVLLTVVLIQGRELWPVWKMAPRLKGFYLLTCLDVVFVGGMAVCQPFDFYTGLYILWIALISSILAMTFIPFRYPETYYFIEKEAAEARYERSRLSGVNVAATLGKLDDLMREEQLFCDPDLDLDQLAMQIKLSAPQLSELLNLHRGLNFSAYVNGFRIERAWTALLEERRMPVIEVAFDCGFNSKSAFNLAFRNTTGMSPSEYRKKNRG